MKSVSPSQSDHVRSRGHLVGRSVHRGFVRFSGASFNHHTARPIFQLAWASSPLPAPFGPHPRLINHAFIPQCLMNLPRSTLLFSVTAPCPHRPPHATLTRNLRCTACCLRRPGSAPRGKHRRPPRPHHLRRRLPPNPRPPVVQVLFVLDEGTSCCQRWRSRHDRRAARVVGPQCPSRLVVLSLFLFFHVEPTTRPHRRRHRRCCLRKGAAVPREVQRCWLEVVGALGGSETSGRRRDSAFGSDSCYSGLGVWTGSRVEVGVGDKPRTWRHCALLHIE